MLELVDWGRASGPLSELEVVTMMVQYDENCPRSIVCLLWRTSFEGICASTERTLQL